MMMPHRVALALQADGWIVRQDLVWAKPNPMPESVNGWRWQLDETEAQALQFRRGSWRHTRAHEYVFMLVKGMGYWSDQEAVREEGSGRTPGNRTYKYDGLEGHETKQGILAQADIPQTGRNPRSILNIPTSPYKGAHYATFPPALIAPLIQAACPRWCCPVCGQGWAPVVGKATGGSTGHSWHDHSADDRRGNFKVERSEGYDPGRVLGHRPTCDHPHTQAEAVPGTVFDPFVGSGTTVMVARQLLRTGIGLDIGRPYLDEQATIRTGLGQPSNAMNNLPLFRSQDSLDE
jgi:hypothetical protein